ncbi:hypothetical protein [Treponema primitia]|uniref:hypothetical protein n=1 Tax=Treponema primitia TaxID=88058 RepID=UPI0002555324|nr:hypothetical protein [Treponema primitia]
MRGINISNEKKRDARIGFEAFPKKPSVKLVLPDGRDRRNIKFLKTTASAESLIKKYGDANTLGEALIAGDPEVDMELAGRILTKTYKLYQTGDGEIAYKVDFVQVLYNPDGTEKERRDMSKALANVSVDIPLQWTGREISKEEAVRKFVFAKNYQLRHTSGLSFDFLYDMAKTLQEHKSLMMIGAGKKGSDPIILSAGGEPYRGFLEGRIVDAGKAGPQYCLILHLTNMELKTPD